MSYASSSTFGASSSSIPSTSYAKGPPLTIYAPDPCLGAEGAALPSPTSPTTPKKPSAKSLGKRRETPRGGVKIVPSNPVGARISVPTSSASIKGKQSSKTTAEDGTGVRIGVNATTERTPLLSRSSRSTALSGRSEGDARKRFYRARPLWCVSLSISCCCMLMS